MPFDLSIVVGAEGARSCRRVSANSARRCLPPLGRALGLMPVWEVYRAETLVSQVMRFMPWKRYSCILAATVAISAYTVSAVFGTAKAVHAPHGGRLQRLHPAPYRVLPSLRFLGSLGHLPSRPPVPFQTGMRITPIDSIRERNSSSPLEKCCGSVQQHAAEAEGRRVLQRVPRPLRRVQR